MTRFSITTKKLEIDGQEYVIKPLTGRHYGKFMRVMKTFGTIEAEDPKEVFAELDPDAFQLAHELCVETMAVAYPDQKREDIDPWVTQHFNELFEIVVQVNMPDDRA